MTEPDPNIATVRALTGAADGDIDDAGITALLAVENAAVRLAAADVLELMAGRLLTVKGDDISVDGSKQAAALQTRADRLRTEHYEHGGDFYFDTTPVESDCYRHLGPGYTDFQWGYPADEVI